MVGSDLRLELFEPDPNTIVDIPSELLVLDAENPRLSWRDGDSSQKTLLKIMWTEMAVEEIALSIAEKGFLRSEPLFVTTQNPNEKRPQSRRYVVVEGNRRLSAVRLLCDEELRRAVGAVNLPNISEERRLGLFRLPAIVYSDRRDLWSAVGYRHIKGILAWDSFSKAQYVAQVHEEYGVSLKEIADTIGDRHETAKRLYRGYKILKQAESMDVFNPEDMARNRFYFSHLYTAADQKEYQDFLGIEPENSLRPDPVPQSKRNELGELMLWLYGKKSERKEPVVRRQNPDLNTLRRVVGNPEALSALRSGYSLEQAQNIAVGDERRLRDSLIKAKVELQTARGTVTPGYSGEEDLYKLITEIVDLANSLEEEMRKKRAKLDNQESTYSPKRGRQ